MSIVCRSLRSGHRLSNELEGSGLSDLVGLWPSQSLPRRDQKLRLPQALLRFPCLKHRPPTPVPSLLHFHRSYYPSLPIPSPMTFYEGIKVNYWTADRHSSTRHAILLLSCLATFDHHLMGRHVPRPRKRPDGDVPQLLRIAKYPRRLRRCLRQARRKRGCWGPHPTLRPGRTYSASSGASRRSRRPRP